MQGSEASETLRVEAWQRTILVWVAFLLTLSVVIVPVGPVFAFLLIPLAAVGLGLHSLASRGHKNPQIIAGERSSRLAGIALGATTVLGTVIVLAIVAMRFEWTEFALGTVLMWCLVSVFLGLVVFWFTSGPQRMVFSACFSLTALFLSAVAHREVGIDVLVFLGDGARALVSGVNPWTIGFDSPYSPELTREYYGDAVHDGQRLLFGFPYPPVPLFVAVAGLIVGEVRMGAVVLHLIAAFVLFRCANDSRGRTLAILYLCSPGVFWTALAGWTELIGSSLLALSICALTRNSRSASLLLGLLVASKQYFAFFVPLVLLLLPSGRRLKGGLLVNAGIVASTGVLALLPFLLWDPSAFLDSVVILQFNQPWRTDAFSLLVWWGENVSEVPEIFVSVLPLGAAVGVSLILGLRAPKEPWAFSASLGIAMCAMVLLSKQSFANYYSFAAAAVLIAAILFQDRSVFDSDS